MGKAIQFIGEVFDTPKGNILTVVESDGKHSSKRRYTLTCSECSLDKDLWPYGSIMSTMSNLKNGLIPCGCSKAPKWTKEQYKIKVERRCDELGYNFIDFCEWKGKSTKLVIHNPLSGNTWDSSNIGNFLGGRSTDPKLSVKNKMKKYHRLRKDDLQKELYSIGILPKGFSVDILDGTENDKSVIMYSCPLCKEDEYSREGGFSYKFKCVAHHLRKGILPCRCAKNYRWRKEEVEYFLEKTINTSGGYYIGLYDGTWKVTSKFKYICKEGHYNDNTRIGNFKNGAGCLQCYNELGRNPNCFNGFYPERVDETDYLYIYNFDNEYIKIGRTFKIDVRYLQLVNTSKASQVTLLHTFTASHQAIYDCEQYVHSKLREVNLSYDSGWTSESFTLESLDLALKLIAKENVEVC